MGFLGCVEIPDVMNPLVGLQFGLPPLVLLVPSNTKQATRFVIAVRRTKVLHVLATIDFTQVADTVIGSDAIDVIDLFGRPFACRNEPCQTMSEINSVVQFDLPIAVACL